MDAISYAFSRRWTWKTREYRLLAKRKHTAAGEASKNEDRGVQERERRVFLLLFEHKEQKKTRAAEVSLSLSLLLCRSRTPSLPHPRGNRPSSAERKNGVVAVQTRGREKTEKKKQCLPLRQVHFRPLSSAGSAPPAPPRASCAATPRPARLPAPAGAAAPSPGTGA